MGHQQREPKHGPHHPPPAPDPDVVKARGQARLIPQLLETAAAQRAALIAAKQAGDAYKIALAAEDLARTQLLLEAAGHVIDDSIMLPGGDASELTSANETAKAAAKSLAHDVVKARAQAIRLEHARTGTLSELDTASGAPTSPEATRARADEQAPPGLCDDKEVQGPDSQVCPLEDGQRERVRTKVRDTLKTIMTNWKQAILKEEFKTQIAALAKDHGLNPLAEVLIDAISFGVGGKASSMVIKYADRAAGRGPLAKSAVTGLVKKLSSRTMKALVSSSDAPSVSISAQLDRVAAAWANSARDDVDQLTDPDLVALSEQLAETPHDQAYFDQKVAALTTAYRTVAALGSSDFTGEPLRLAWITSPGSPAQLATYRRHAVGLSPGLTEMVTDVASTLAGSPRLDFEEWVDPSMYALALAREPAPLRVEATDTRWVTFPLMLTAPDEGFEMIGVNPEKDLR